MAEIGKGHNSDAYGQEPRTSLEILYSTFEEEWNAPVYSEGELTDAPFGVGEIDDSSENVDYYLDVMCHWGEDVGGEPEPTLPSHHPVEQPAETKPVRSVPYIKKPIPTELRWAVFRRDGYRCVHCGYDADLTADHIEPEVKGGRTGVDNLQTLCRSCNSKKGAKSC